MKKPLLLLTDKENVNPAPAPDGTVTLNCVRPVYLMAGKVF